jgi:hypothetical protein
MAAPDTLVEPRHAGELDGPAEQKLSTIVTAVVPRSPREGLRHL